MPVPKPCSTLETHVWSLGETTYLSLPTLDDWCDVFRAWHCRRCGLQTWATGAITTTTPPLTPVEWEARADWQHAHGDAYAQASKEQERWGTERRVVSRRLSIHTRQIAKLREHAHG